MLRDFSDLHFFPPLPCGHTILSIRWRKTTMQPSADNPDTKATLATIHRMNRTKTKINTDQSKNT